MGGYVEGLRCISCGRSFSLDHPHYACTSCGGLLDVTYDYSELEGQSLLAKWSRRPMGVWRYRELLPADHSMAVTLGEGGTGLHRCIRLGGALGLKRLFVKNEGENPTGSFKDRGMTVGVTRALELGVKATACASTGNTSASLAAYSARAGLACLVLVPSGRIARGKLVQAIAHGAKVVAIKGGFDDALREVRRLCEGRKLYLLNSINPFRLEGQKTLAYEVYEQLGHQAPDVVVVPVGNAGNISAIWKGFKELRALGLIERAPRMMGVQAEGASPFASMIREGRETLIPVERPETVASAIRIGSPVNWPKARAAVLESGGWAVVVSDQEIIEAQRRLARLEGLFVEPASAASIAGLARLIEEGLVDRDETVVCVATGHGLKDPDVVLSHYEGAVEVEPERVESYVDELLRGVGGG
ncbi:threonine synthase [Candidatus Geothermarchaeota archaeon ex4572_27]|nr:MAG: threonine synthase [Candidatus Geothermarchaeota archaeon ex4572_27]